jgi:TPR repeat protein
MNHVKFVATALVMLLCSGAALAQKPSAEEAFKMGEALAEKKDFAGAMRNYRIAADQGHLESQNDVGMFYVMGMGVAKNVAEGEKWLRKAANAGHPTAQRNMGFLYMEGMGVPKDRAKAIAWFRKAAAQGDDEAIAGLKALGAK